MKRTSKVRGLPWWRRWSTWRRITAAMFLALLGAGRLEDVTWIRGTTSATTFVEVVPFVDPLAALESTLASGTITGDIIIGAGLLVTVAVLLGPVFCGFVCPLGLVLDLNQALRRRVRPRAPPRKPLAASSRRIRLGVLVAIAVFALVAGVPLFQALSPINLLVRAIVIGAWSGMVVVGAIVIVEWFVPRLWCRVLCPLGAVYAMLGRRALFRIRAADPENTPRAPCFKCDAVCPMGIPVIADVAGATTGTLRDPTCIRCGDCVDVCPRGVLRLGIRPRTRRPTRGGGGVACHLPVVAAADTGQDRPPDAEPHATSVVRPVAAPSGRVWRARGIFKNSRPCILDSSADPPILTVGGGR